MVDVLGIVLDVAVELGVVLVDDAVDELVEVGTAVEVVVLVDAVINNIYHDLIVMADA